MKLTLLGQEFTLCYTISAQIKISDYLGGLDKLQDAITDSEKGAENLLFLVAALMRGGEERERLRCKMYDEEYTGRVALTAEQLREAVTPGDLAELLKVVIETMKDGNKVTVELAPSKKGGATR